MKKTVSLLFFLTFVIATGCSTTPSVKPLHTNVPQKPAIVKTEQIHFPETIFPAAPVEPPETVKQSVEAGLFMFENGAFSQAALAFEKAGNMLVEPKGKFYRQCQKAAAVSWLVADRPDRFIAAVNRCQYAYSKFERIQMRNNNNKINQLIFLADKLKN